MMDTPAPHFPLPLIGQFLDHGRRLRLHEPFTFVDGALKVEIPKAFVSDFNSVPRLLWIWMPPWEFPHAGVVHDYLYQNPGSMPRRECDEVHRRILQLEGMRESKRNVAFLGIRAGGWKPWNRYRALDAARIAHLLTLKDRARRKVGKDVS